MAPSTPSEREAELQALIVRALPVIGSHGRGFAQQLLAEMCLAVGHNPYTWTAHPETLQRRVALLPKRAQTKIERRKAADV